MLNRAYRSTSAWRASQQGVILVKRVALITVRQQLQVSLLHVGSKVKSHEAEQSLARSCSGQHAAVFAISQVASRAATDAADTLNCMHPSSTVTHISVVCLVLTNVPPFSFQTCW